MLDGRKVSSPTGVAGAALVFARPTAVWGGGESAPYGREDTPGSPWSDEDKLGIRASDTAELLFEGCRVP